MYIILLGRLTHYQWKQYALRPFCIFFFQCSIHIGEMSLRCAELAACRTQGNLCRQVERNIKSSICGTAKISAKADITPFTAFYFSLFIFPFLFPTWAVLSLQSCTILPHPGLHDSSTPKPLSFFAFIAALPYASAGQYIYFKTLSDFALYQQVPGTRVHGLHFYSLSCCLFLRQNYCSSWGLSTLWMYEMSPSMWLA